MWRAMVLWPMKGLLHSAAACFIQFGCRCLSFVPLTNHMLLLLLLLCCRCTRYCCCTSHCCCCQGHTFICTDDKGPGGLADKVLPDADIVISTPFHREHAQDFLLVLAFTLGGMNWNSLPLDSECCA
jgi:hypothetical protein